MPLVTSVVFKRVGKAYYFNPDKWDLKIGDGVIVKTSRGIDFGRVVSPPHEVPKSEISAPLKKVLRKATEEDETQLVKNEAKAAEAFKICLEKIKAQGLPMKLIDVEYIFDASRAIFYFTAEERVDFRNLVKELTSALSTRVELRQVGVRDEARMIGGLGPCGRRLCCTVFSSDFEPVSIRMAKEQNLPLNPLKISGICGRLMCCLKYEYEVYTDFREKAPPLGREIELSEGKAIVVDYDVPKGKVIVELEGGQRIEVSLEEIKN